MLGENISSNLDEFANIAQRGINFENNSLIIPEPPVKEDRSLLLVSGDAYKINYSPKMYSEKELLEELEKQRSIYEPFMQNHAPEHKDYRKKQFLREFQYRLQTEDDLKDFSVVLLGRGDWETVKIPHYWGPVGKHVAYYRTIFTLCKEDFSDRNIFAYFKAVDYKAHVFINNSYVGSHEGFFAPFEFDITPYSHVGENTIVIICENDFVHFHGGDKIYAATGLGYDEPQVGWHHCPAGMGICQDCYIETRARIHMRDIFVRPILEEKKAICQFETYSCEEADKKITFKISVFGQNFQETLFSDVEFVPQSVYECGLGDTPTQAEMKSSGRYNNSFVLMLN